MRLVIYYTLAILLLASGCATPRSGGILGLNFSEHPPRAAIRGTCNGVPFTTQGVAVCEQHGPSTAQVSVKIPPLEGRVVYSNGQLKKTEDFNWYPKQGFWLWKKKPIKDTWAPLELGEIAATFGDWPVALDVIGVHDKVGLIVTRGLLYHRVCNDADVACSRLVVRYECAGHAHATGAGQIGKCERLAGSPQAFRVELSGPGYKATPGAKLYVAAPRLGLPTTYTPGAADFEAQKFNIELPTVPTGPTLVGIRLAWVEGGKVQQAETRVLLAGFGPEWTGLDQPHVITREVVSYENDPGGYWDDSGSWAGGQTAKKSTALDWVKPVLADMIEVNTYAGRELKNKQFTSDKVLANYPIPGNGQVACAFAWQRDSSDQTYLCVNSQLQEVVLP